MNVKLGKMKTVYKGRIFEFKKRDVWENGAHKIFEYCVRPSSVSILPFDEKGRLLLINEYRHGYNKNTWFLPGGRVDKGESPLRAARRELAEEAKVKAKTLKFLHQKTPSNTLVWDIFVYVAKDLTPVKAKGDESFPIKVVPTSLKKAVKMAISGEIENEFIAYNIIRFDYMLKHKEFKW